MGAERKHRKYGGTRDKQFINECKVKITKLLKLLIKGVWANIEHLIGSVIKRKILNCIKVINFRVD